MKRESHFISSHAYNVLCQWWFELKKNVKKAGIVRVYCIYTTEACIVFYLFILFINFVGVDLTIHWWGIIYFDSFLQSKIKYSSVYIRYDRKETLEMEKMKIIFVHRVFYDQNMYEGFQWKIIFILCADIMKIIGMQSKSVLNANMIKMYLLQKC